MIYRVSTTQPCSWTPPTPTPTAYAFNYYLTMETVSALHAWETTCICGSLSPCACVCERMSKWLCSQLFSHKGSQCVFNAAGSQKLHTGWSCKQTVLKRGTICMHPFPQITSYAVVHKQVRASESVCVCSMCAHCFPPVRSRFGCQPKGEQQWSEFQAIKQIV